MSQGRSAAEIGACPEASRRRTPPRSFAHRRLRRSTFGQARSRGHRARPPSALVRFEGRACTLAANSFPTNSLDAVSFDAMGCVAAVAEALRATKASAISPRPAGFSRKHARASTRSRSRRTKARRARGRQLARRWVPADARLHGASSPRRSLSLFGGDTTAASSGARRAGCASRMRGDEARRAGRARSRAARAHHEAA